MEYPEATLFKKERFVESFGVRIDIGTGGFAVTAGGRIENQPLVVEVYRAGRLIQRDIFQSSGGWFDDCRGSAPGMSLNPAECGLRVLDMLGNVIAVLDVEEDQYPFLRPPDEQRHITENYVSVPPALSITDEAGCVWSLDIRQSYAEKRKSPDGEFALPVLRNGLDTLEVASRIERRSGKIKIFTCEGWKVWTGRSFF